MTSSGEYRRWRLLFDIESRNIRRARALVEFVSHRSIFKHPARAVRPVRPRGSGQRYSKRIPTDTFDHDARARRARLSSFRGLDRVDPSLRHLSTWDLGREPRFRPVARARVSRARLVVATTDGESAVFSLFVHIKVPPALPAGGVGSSSL